jgi:hypothetical protein
MGKPVGNRDVVRWCLRHAPSLDGRREKSMGDIREVRYGHEDTGGWSGRLHA